MFCLLCHGIGTKHEHYVECVCVWLWIVNVTDVWAIDCVIQSVWTIVSVCVCVWTLYEDCDGMCNTVAVFSVNVVNLSISCNDKKPLFASMSK